MKKFFKTYLSNVFLGFFVGLILIFAPSKVIPGAITEKFSEIFFQKFSVFQDNFFLFSIPILVFSLIFFLIYALTPFFTRKLKTAEKKRTFLFASLLSFLIGVLLSYAVFIAVASVAISGASSIW